MERIFKCTKCSNYTLEKECKKCGTDCITIKPAKFSLLDKYGYYRRIAKEK